MAKAKEINYYQNPKKIIEYFKSGSVDEIYKQFDTTMQKKLTPPRLEPIWSQMQRNYGIYTEFVINDTLTESNSIIINTHLIFTKGIMNMMLSWDINSRKINGLYLTEVKKDRLLTKTSNLPLYIDTTKFERENIVIESTYPLDGELTLPKNSTKSTNITFILVAGKGRQSKDVKIGSNKVFKNLAWGLSSYGHSVLRYDKINYKNSRKLIKNKPDYTFKDEYIKPILSSIYKVKSDSRINSNRIILVGYDEGAKAVSEIVSHEHVDGLILLMGSPAKQYETEIDKLKYLFGYDNVISPTEKDMINTAAAKIQYYKSIGTYSKIKKDSLPLGRSYIYLKSIDSLDPITRLSKTHKPILIVNSNNDFEVLENHYKEWTKLSSNNNIKIINLEKIDHLMRSSNGKSHPKFYRNEAPISIKIFERINQWIQLNE